MAKEDLWTFALAFYACPGVAPACLRCQDEAGADVDTMLFALWQAEQGIAVAPAVFADITRETLAWREQVLLKLRALCRRLEPSGGELHDLVKSAEFEAERQHLLSLAEFARYSQTRLAPLVAAHANLTAYQAAAGIDLPADARDDLVAAFAAALRSDFRF